jgi:hypothetical protein
MKDRAKGDGGREGNGLMEPIHQTRKRRDLPPGTQVHLLSFYLAHTSRVALVVVLIEHIDQSISANAP